MPAAIMPPIHPGEILKEEFLEPLGLSQYRVAVDISVPPAPHKRDRARQTRHFGRHGFTTGSLFRNYGSILAKSTDPL